MRHRKAGRQLGRDSAHRRALYRNLVTELLRYERITTTDAKAREIRPIAEKMITLGRRGDLHARRQALRYIYDRYVVEKVFDDLAPRMADRPGGYLRITRLEPRKGDGGEDGCHRRPSTIKKPPRPPRGRGRASIESEQPPAEKLARRQCVRAACEAEATAAVEEPEAEEAPEAEDEER